MKKSEIALIMKRCPGAKIITKQKQKIIKLKGVLAIDNKESQKVGRNVMYKDGEWIP